MVGDYEEMVSDLEKLRSDILIEKQRVRTLKEVLQKIQCLSYGINKHGDSCSGCGNRNMLANVAIRDI